MRERGPRTSPAPTVFTHQPRPFARTHEIRLSLHSQRFAFSVRAGAVAATERGELTRLADSVTYYCRTVTRSAFGAERRCLPHPIRQGILLQSCHQRATRQRREGNCFP